MCVAVAWSVEGRGAGGVASLRHERDAGTTETQRRRDNRDERERRKGRKKGKRRERRERRQRSRASYFLLFFLSLLSALLSVVSASLRLCVSVVSFDCASLCCLCVSVVSLSSCPPRAWRGQALRDRQARRYARAAAQRGLARPYPRRLVYILFMEV